MIDPLLIVALLLHFFYFFFKCAPLLQLHNEQYLFGDPLLIEKLIVIHYYQLTRGLS